MAASRSPRLAPLAPLASWRPTGSSPASSDFMLLHTMILSDYFFDKFLVGRKFHTSHREFILAEFMRSPGLLHDVFMACALNWDTTQRRTSREAEIVSSELARFRDFRVEGPEHIYQCLVLGVMLLTAARKTSLLDAVAISNLTLQLIKPSYESTPSDKPSNMVVVTCFVMHNLLDSLFHCRLPILRVKSPGDAGVDPCGPIDRYMGLSYELLPYLYDICEISKALHRADINDIFDTLVALDGIERAVTEWQVPQIQGLSEFSPAELSHLICQAQVMQQASLLLIHRLRYPYGLEDAVAQTMANTILSQLDMTWRVTGSAVRRVDLAWLLCGLELKTPERRRTWSGRLASMAGHFFRPVEFVRDVVRSFWDMDPPFSLYFYDLHEHIPHLA